MSARNPVPKPCSVFRKLPCCSASAFAIAAAETRPRPTRTSPRRPPERSCSASASPRSRSLTNPASISSEPSRRRPGSARSILVPINRPQRSRPDSLAVSALLLRSSEQSWDCSVHEFHGARRVAAGLPGAHQQIDGHPLGLSVVGANQGKLDFVLADPLDNHLQPQLQELKKVW